MKRWSKKIYIYISRAIFSYKFRSVPIRLLSPRVRDSTKTVSWLSFALAQKCCVSPFANPAHFSPVCTETGLHLIPASRSNDAFQRSPLLILLSLVYSSLSRFALLFQDHASFLPLSFLHLFSAERVCTRGWKDCERVDDSLIDAWRYLQRCQCNDLSSFR